MDVVLSPRSPLFDDIDPLETAVRRVRAEHFDCVSDCGYALDELAIEVGANHA